MSGVCASNRPHIPMSSITSFGQNLGRGNLEELGRELEADAESDILVGPVCAKLWSLSNAVLLYAHSGRLEAAKEKLQAAKDIRLREMKDVDDRSSRHGVRRESISKCLTNLVIASAFIHFLDTGRLLRYQDLGEGFTDSEYLAAVMALTSELSRYTITQASVLDQESIRACAALTESLFGELIQFDFRNGSLRGRYDGVKYNIRRMNDVLYELSLVEWRGPGNHGGSNRVAADMEAGRKRVRDVREGERKQIEPGAGESDEYVGFLDPAEFEAFRLGMAVFDEQRERVIKRTRDIQKQSKMAIYSLHRDDFQEAEKHLSACRTIATDLLPLITGTPLLRPGSFSNCMEEYAEARLYQTWLQEKRLITIQELGMVNLDEYLGGILDLTGELNRYAVARATKRDVDGVRECLETVLVINEFVTLHPLPGKLVKKKRELASCLQKLQNTTYELALTRAGKGTVTGVSGMDEAAVDHFD